MINSIISEEHDSSLLLLNLVVQDLLTIQENNAVEYPIAIVLLKAIILQLITCIETVDDKKPIDLHHRIAFIDLI